MLAVVNPLLPAWYDVVWSAAAAVGLALLLAAIISIARHARPLSWGAFALWILVVLVAPVLGPLLWFVVGRASARSAASNVSSRRASA